MSRLGPLLRRAGLVLGTGYVLCFFSETMFWAVIRPDDDPFGRVAQWLLYSLLAYLTLAALHAARASDRAALILAGAFYGWIDEGVFAMTVYGDPSMPFPATIAWTALAWHGPISLAVGWYALGLALRRRSPLRTAWLSLLLGLFWGIWAFGWLAETPPVGATPGGFFLHAVATTLCLWAAHCAVAWGRPGEFAPSRPGVILAALAVLGFFGAFTIPTVPIAPLVLLPLLALLGLALRRHRAAGTASGILAALAAPVLWRNLPALLLMPLSATLVYGFTTGEMPPSPAVHLGLAAATSLGGLVLFVVALVRAFRAPRREIAA